MSAPDRGPSARRCPTGACGCTRRSWSPSWIDYNGHMTEYRYLEVMADTTDAFLRAIGVIGPYIDAGRSYYTVETHIRHLGEAHGGDRI